MTPTRPATLTALLALIALLSAAASSPAAAPPKVGDPVPPLGVETLLNAPDGAAVDFEGDLKGKVVVLEFWATWCGPCVSAIPHMNELTEQFADEDVRFVSITAEGSDVIEPFLKQRPIAGWVGLDPDHSAAQTFAVRGIPRTIVVGRDGKVAADTYPTMLEAEHLEQALAGEPVTLEEQGDPATVEIEPLRQDGEAVLVEAWVRPTTATDPGGSSMGGANEVKIINLPARNLVYTTYNGRMHGNRLALQAELPEGKFDLYVRVPPERAFQVDELVWETVAFAFGLVKYDEVRETDVFELRVVEGQDDRRSAVAPEAKPSVMPDFDFSDGNTLDAKSITPGSLCFELNNLFSSPVVDGMTDRRPFDMNATVPPIELGEGWEQRKLTAVNAALADYGLELVPSRRPVEHTVVAPRGTYQQEDSGATTRPGGPATRPIE